jgi:hypothetical protein
VVEFSNSTFQCVLNGYSAGIVTLGVGIPFNTIGATSSVTSSTVASNTSLPTSTSSTLPLSSKSSTGSPGNISPPTLTPGADAGIAIGVILAFLLLLAGYLMLSRLRKTAKAASGPFPSGPELDGANDRKEMDPGTRQAELEVSYLTTVGIETREVGPVAPTELPCELSH